MSDEICHVWLGAFGSDEALDDYFEESHPTDENAPINRFAADQGLGFYDHDWVEAIRCAGSSLEDLVGSASYSECYAEAVVCAARDRELRAVDTIVVAFENVVPAPVSVDAAGHRLSYLGAYAFAS